MSLDRCLAVTRPVSSVTIHSERTVCIAIGVLWIIGMSINIPLFQHTQQETYAVFEKEQSVCIQTFPNTEHAKIWNICFFVLSYVIPVLAICILCSCMCIGSHCNFKKSYPSAESMRSEKQLTLMVWVVAIVFVLCLLPINVMQMISLFEIFHTSIDFAGLFIAFNCIACLGSCVNPFIYAALSENFRRSFRNLLCCCNKDQSVTSEDQSAFDKNHSAFDKDKSAIGECKGTNDHGLDIMG